MVIQIAVNGKNYSWEVGHGQTLLDVLRREGYFSIKCGGCSNGECGACTVLLDGQTINSCTLLAVQAAGHQITTVESMGEHPEHGWRESIGLHTIQQAFIESGAIQCGFCTPAMVLAAKSLLDKNPDPSEVDVRDALSGILCRCTGYLKPVEAILAAAKMIKEGKTGKGTNYLDHDDWARNDGFPTIGSDLLTSAQTRTEVNISTRTEKWHSVGKPKQKVDSIKLVQGKPAFTNDIDLRGILVGKILHSPYSHAEILDIDVTGARKLPGVAAVLTWKDIPRVAYSTAGQSDPIPGPLDSFSLDHKVRFVGDRVAFIAAESDEIARKGLSLIKVTYKELPAIQDSTRAMEENAVVIHDEPEYTHFADSKPEHNLAAKIRIDIGNVDFGFKQADFIFEGDYEVPKVQQSHIEPHVVITYWDEDDRLVVRSSTQVPFHARRILSGVLQLPIKRIRVIKPRIGGGFGNKQEVLIEDVAAHLTIATGRPVRVEYDRKEEFIASRSRHPMKIHMKTGVKKDGTITANEMVCLSDTGAYGCHALTVTGNTGHKSMALYVGDGEYRKSPNIRFYADIVYTNHPPAGAYRGYGVPQGFWAVERHMEKISRKLTLDPIEFRLKNSIRAGELHPFSTAWSEGREPRPEIIHTVGLEECIQQGKSIIGWDQKYGNPSWHLVPSKPHLRKGIGIAAVMQGTAIPYLDMGGASIKMNDDGSFNLLVGATDLGTGSDTVLAQMAAEILGVEIEDIIVYSSDTDFTPFDKGAYASSTTYISGAAVSKAAEQVADRLRHRAANLLRAKTGDQTITAAEIILSDSRAFDPKGRSVTLSEIGLDALHHQDQEQIMAVASFVSPVSPPPFAAQFAEVTVDIETGKVIVDNLVMALDCGIIVNPVTASGQVEGGMTQALGYAVCEEMRYDEKGASLDADWINYHIFRADEMPQLSTIFIQTYEPSHPFGVKAVAEIPMDGVAPAVGNAILDACGADLSSIPATPERIWKALQEIKGEVE